MFYKIPCRYIAFEFLLSAIFLELLGQGPKRSLGIFGLYWSRTFHRLGTLAVATFTGNVSES